MLIAKENRATERAAALLQEARRPNDHKVV